MHIPATGSNIKYGYNLEVDIIDPARFDIGLKDATQEQLDSWTVPSYMFLVMAYAGYPSDRQVRVSSNCPEFGTMTATFSTMEEFKLAKALVELKVDTASKTTMHQYGMVRHTCDVTFADDVTVRVTNTDFRKFTQTLRETIMDIWEKSKGIQHEKH